jgi:hypothetical protein
VQFDGEKPDKITRVACACNDDKVIFESPLNWTTRSFIFAKQGSTNMGACTPEPSGEVSRDTISSVGGHHNYVVTFPEGCYGWVSNGVYPGSPPAWLLRGVSGDRRHIRSVGRHFFVCLHRLS